MLLKNLKECKSKPMKQKIPKIVIYILACTGDEILDKLLDENEINDTINRNIMKQTSSLSVHGKRNTRGP